MSNVYATEPATTGKVIFETTHGPLEIQLFCRECPKTTKFFLQLCLDGFYDDMVFHRVMPNFLIQTGAIRMPTDPTKKSSVNENDMQKYYDAVGAGEVLQRRHYELHSRLRFSHRGIVAMALGVDDDRDVTLVQPQFFITLVDAPYLDGKHVIFGTITGPTIFNAIRIGNREIDEQTNQPVDLIDAPRVKSVRIVDNQFHNDIIPQSITPWKIARTDDETTKHKKKRKGNLDTNVLSFGMELDDTEQSFSIKRAPNKKQKDEKMKISDVKIERQTAENSGQQANLQEESEINVNVNASYHYKQSGSQGAASSLHLNAAHEKEAESNKMQKKEDEYKTTGGNLVEKRRSKYLSSLSNRQRREEETMNKLLAFQSKVKSQVSWEKNSKINGSNGESLASRMARRAERDEGSQHGGTVAHHGQILDKNDDKMDHSASWMATKFRCTKHLDHEAREAMGGDGRSAEDFEVIDERNHHERHFVKRSGRHHSPHKHRGREPADPNRRHKY